MKLNETGPEPFFEDVVNHMAAICGTPFAMVALRAPDRQWISAPGAETGREGGDGARAIARALGWSDTEIADIPPGSEIAAALSAAAPGAGNLRSFISRRLIVDGHEIGALHIADMEPRTWTVFEIGYMARAARLVAGHFEARALLAERDRRMELEGRLAEAGALHSAVINTMSEGVLVLARDGKILTANRASLEILGVSAEDAIARAPRDNAWRILMADGSRMGWDEHPAHLAFTTGAPQIATEMGVERDGGEVRWLHVNAIPLLRPEASQGGAGAAAGDQVVVTFTDITERRRTMEQLRAARAEAEAASRAKSAFLANMSHEIRTPLNGVLGMAQVLETSALDAVQRGHVRTITDSGRTLMTLLNDVLDLSKIEAGRFDIVPADHGFEQMLRGLHALWKPQAEEKGLALILMLDQEAPERMRFDQVRVQQCLTNFLSNAIKFTAHGEVKIGARVIAEGEGGYRVEVDVSDTGPGVDAETQARLFSPFVQADETISRRHGGSGLGLSITRRLAELMGGTAAMTSRPGKGSVFTLVFRAGEADEAQAVAAKASPESAHPAVRRILLVDDHPVNRQVARLFLAPTGAEVVEAANGVEALEALERGTFDVVLLDIHMPVMDGPTTIARIRQSQAGYANVTVISLTADAMNGDKERFLAMGMDGYVCKPLAAPDLLHALATVRRRAA